MIPIVDGSSLAANRNQSSNLQKNLNEQDSRELSEAQHQFIEDLGQHMVAWGLSRTTGRVYAYLLLRAEPAGLDQIASELEMAKSGASVATRQLVGLGLVRGTGQRGSRRLLYGALYDTEAILAARNSQTRDFLDQIRRGARVAPAGPAQGQLQELALELQELYAEIPGLVRRILVRRRTAEGAQTTSPASR